MKRIFTTLLLIILCFSLKAQGNDYELPDSLAVLLQNNGKSNLNRVESLIKIVDVLFDNRQYIIASPYVNEIVILAEEENDSYLKILGYYYLGTMLIAKNDFQEAFNYLLKARNMAVEIRESPQLLRLKIRITNSLGGCYFKCQMLPESYECFQNGVEMNTILNDAKLNDKLENNLLLIYSAMGKYLESIEIGKKIVNDSADTNRDKFIPYFRIASDYMNMQYYDTAFMYLDTASRYVLSPNDKALVLAYKGDVFYSEKNYNKAIDSYKKCLDIASEMNNTEIESSILIKTGFAYYRLSKIDTALSLIDNGIEKAKLGKFLSLETYGLSQKNEILYDLGLFNDYSKSVKKYIVLSDSLKKIEDVNHLGQLVLQRQFKEIEAQYKYNQSIKEMKYRQHRIILGFVILILIFIVIIMILVLSRKKILLKNEQIKEQSLTVELESRNRELASNVVTLMKKNEVFTEIINKLLIIRKNAVKDETKEAILKVTKEIEKTIEGKFWEDFEVRFKQVYSDFYDRLTTKYPDLTANEIRLCSFLKLNLNTKEISSITGQSVQAIEKARGRLRTKLGISTEFSENLSNFISKI